MTEPAAALVERLTGRKVAGTRSLSGGRGGKVLLVSLADGGRVVAKLGPGIGAEGWMLRTLARHSHLPVPHLVHGDDRILLMDYIEAGDSLGPVAEAHAAELLAALHANSWHSFGLDRDTVIGGLPQVNTPNPRWLDFFRDNRLLAMAEQARAAGRLPAITMARIELLAGRLGTWLAEPAQPALLHGDAWAGNVLVRGEKVAAFIDPAISYGHPEIELAFGTMFGSFNAPFFRRYEEISPLAPGFWEERREIYLLYPLLVHTRLFGGSYLAGIDRILDRFLG